MCCWRGCRSWYSSLGRKLRPRTFVSPDRKKADPQDQRPAYKLIQSSERPALWLPDTHPPLLYLRSLLYRGRPFLDLQPSCEYTSLYKILELTDWVAHNESLRTLTQAHLSLNRQEVLLSRIRQLSCFKEKASAGAFRVSAFEAFLPVSSAMV